MDTGNNQTRLSADLNLVYQSMPAELVNEEGYRRLSAVTDMLPAALTNFWGLECRLHEPAPLSDILLEIKRNSSGHKLLADPGASGMDTLFQDYAVWREIRGFAQQWLLSESLLSSHILNMWLEFDTEKPVSREDMTNFIARPSVFLGFRSAGLTTGELRALLEQSAALLRLSTEIIEVLSFVGSIPSPGQLFQLGSMLGRPSRDIRLCINRLGHDMIPGWLSDMGWQGDRKALAGILGVLAPIVRTFAIDLNLAETGISEKIGIECYMDWDEKDPGIWAGFLDRLDGYVPIHPFKRSGLLMYPGELRLPAFRRKENPDALSLLLCKMIHHVKLGFNEGAVSDAKAYLAIYRPGIQPGNNWLAE